MKKILIVLLLSFSYVFANSQVIVNRAGQANTVSDARLEGRLNLYTPRYADTTAANVSKGIDSCGAIIYTYVTQGFWYRKCSPKRWEQITSGGGGGISVASYGKNATRDSTVLVLSDGSRYAAKDSAGIDAFTCDGLLKGGTVTWDSLLVFSVAPAAYCINNVADTSLSQSITLNPADPSLPRIDVIGIDTNGLVFKITGTPAADPAIPQIEPSSQLYLTSVFIAAGATTPTPLPSNVIIWNENIGAPTEYIGSASGLTVNFDYATPANVYAPVKSTDVGAFTVNDIITYSGTPAYSTTAYPILRFFIKNKAALASSANISVQLMSGGVVRTASLVLGAAQGYSKTNITTFQNISLNISNFNFFQLTPTIDGIRFITSGSGAGFYIDYITLNAGVSGNPPPTNNGAAFTETDDTNVTATLTGTPLTSLLQSVNLSLGWTGTLAATRGGTGTGTVAVGDILYGSGVNTWSKLPIGIAGQKLTIVGGIPAWRDTVSLTGLYVATNFITKVNDSTLGFDSTRVGTSLAKNAGGDSTRLLSGSGSILSTVLDRGGTGSTNSNVGAGYRWVIPNTNNIKTVSAGTNITIDSTTNANELIINATPGGTVTPAALTKTDDTNVTVTLGGTPATALLQATSLTLGWTGNLAATRGGTGTATVAVGDLLYGSGVNTWSKLPIGTAAQHLVVVGGLPAWRDTAAAGGGGSGWGLTGNAGTTAGTNFIGTTDDVDFMIKRNSQISGYINSVSKLTSFGLRAGNITTTTGVNNTSIGYDALAAITTAGNNTAVGTQALLLNTGSDNVAIGAQSLDANTTGTTNVAVGSQALGLSQTAGNSTAVGYNSASKSTVTITAFGYSSALNNTSGGSNTAIGFRALETNTTNGDNTAIGAGALLANTGQRNTGVGSGALGNGTNTSGLSTAIGYAAGQNNTGTSNTFLGYTAGQNNTSGGSNLFIGANAGKNNTTVSNQTFIDNLARATYALDQTGSVFYSVSNASIPSQTVTLNGRVGLNFVTPTSWLNLTVGSPAVGYSPLKFSTPRSAVATTAASGTGATATITHGALYPQFIVGTTITVAGVTPTGYNGTFTITAATNTTVSYANATTGAQTVAGTIAQSSLLTTPETGAVEYDGSDLFFTRTGTTRESILTGVANVVSPTAPNRTISVVINGTTYYIHAKTTND